MNDNCYNCRDLQQQVNELRAELEAQKLENISLVTSTMLKSRWDHMNSIIKPITTWKEDFVCADPICDLCHPEKTND